MAFFSCSILIQLSKALCKFLTSRCSRTNRVNQTKDAFNRNLHQIGHLHGILIHPPCRFHRWPSPRISPDPRRPGLVEQKPGQEVVVSKMFWKCHPVVRVCSTNICHALSSPKVKRKVLKVRHWLSSELLRGRSSRDYKNQLRQTYIRVDSGDPESLMDIDLKAASPIMVPWLHMGW